MKDPFATHLTETIQQSFHDFPSIINRNLFLHLQKGIQSDSSNILHCKVQRVLSFVHSMKANNVV